MGDYTPYVIYVYIYDWVCMCVCKVIYIYTHNLDIIWPSIPCKWTTSIEHKMAQSIEDPFIDFPQKDIVVTHPKMDLLDLLEWHRFLGPANSISVALCCRPGWLSSLLFGSFAARMPCSYPTDGWHFNPLTWNQSFASDEHELSFQGGTDFEQIQSFEILLLC